MNQKEIIASIASRLGSTQKSVEDVINALLNEEVIWFEI